VKTIKNTTVKSHLPITGRVIPKYTTQLVAEVQGRILSSEKSFKAGTTFRKGEVLLQLDSREFALNLESQKSAFLNILTGLMPDLKSDYPENYQNWLNYVNNYKTGKPLPPLPQTASKPEKYFVTSRQVYTTYYNIKAQEDRLSKFTLVAPFSGSLSSTTIDTGGLVSPGQPLGTFISDGNYELETAVSIELGSTLKIGQQIEFESRALGQTFTATVSRINNIVDPTTQNIPVFLRIRDSRLRSGMYLEGKVVSTSFQNAINIPSSTVNRDNTVHILNNGIISKAPVEIVGQTEDEVIVRGLEDEVKLVLTTFDYPIAGLKIAQ
ncbi:MAG: HlyD family efflux transporter periplasmic adaptor subunit, partial [Bacteroidota bacterium]